MKWVLERLCSRLSLFIAVLTVAPPAGAGVEIPADSWKALGFKSAEDLEK